MLDPTRLLRVLVVEDSEDDCELVVRLLHRAGYEVRHRRVETAVQMRSALETQPWDLVIADWTLPQFSAPGARSVLTASGLDLPFIVVSGTIGEETAVVALKSGAHDFMVKENTTRLPFAVDRELRAAEVRRAERRASAELVRSEQLLRLVNDSVPSGLIAVDRDGRCILWNRAAEALLRMGCTDLELSAWPGHYGFCLPDRTTPCPSERLPLARALQGQEVEDEPLFVCNERLPPEGLELRVHARPLLDELGDVLGAVAILRAA